VSERASQTTTLIFGGVSAEIGLVKTSSKPKEARHEVRRMIGDLPADEAQARALADWAERHGVTTETVEPEAESLADGLARVGSAAAQKADERFRGLADDPFGPADAAEIVLTRKPLGDVEGPFDGLPPERVEHGVTLDDGTWIDLTDQLATIDERTRIEGMEVVATITGHAVPRTWIRDSHWVTLAGGAGQRDAKVLALLWFALRDTDEAAVVRWTKRTNQSLGIIVATGVRSVPESMALCVLEVEWPQNRRKPGARSSTPISAETSDRERNAAVELVRSLHEPPSVLVALRDERSGARADLLSAAREGRLGEVTLPPARVPVGEVEDLAAALEPTS
jgi:hypothetical protein